MLLEIVVPANVIPQCPPRNQSRRVGAQKPEGGRFTVEFEPYHVLGIYLCQPEPPAGVEADLDRVLHPSRTSPCAAQS